MANYTEHYQLHQWEPTDDFLRTDFNTDFAKIDAALGEKADAATLAEKCGAVTGTYIGDGAASKAINLGFSPKAVILREAEAAAPCFAAAGGPDVEEDYNGDVMMELTDQGFTVHYKVFYIGANQNISSPYTNREWETYTYLALKQ